MFNAKPYLTVNREERFFCFLLAHSVLSSSLFRSRFVDLVKQKLKVQLNPDRIELFVEAAALRDYFDDLGDYDRDKVGTEQRRRDVLLQVLEEGGIAAEVFHQHPDLFLTSSGKIWSPARWNKERAKELNPRLFDLRCAFNAKPDLLLTVDAEVILFEAKVESGVSRNSDGYDQLETQKLIARLLKRLVPAFTDSHFTNATIGCRRDSDIRWHDIVEIARCVETDSFTQRGFAELAMRYC